MSKFIVVALLLNIASAWAIADETASIDSTPRHKTPKQPQLAVDAQGQIHLVFGSETSIFYCVSTDQGKNFREPVLVAKPTKLSLGMRRSPASRSAESEYSSRPSRASLAEARMAIYCYGVQRTKAEPGLLRQ